MIFFSYSKRLHPGNSMGPGIGIAPRIRFCLPGIRTANGKSNSIAQRIYQSYDVPLQNLWFATSGII